LPTRNPEGSAGANRVVRCVTQPEEHLAVLVHRLGLKLPTQLARFRLAAGKEVSTAQM